MPATMQAMLLRTHGASEVLEVARLPVAQPGPGQILVENATCALNFIDIIARKGELPPTVQLPLPFIPGVEGAGVVSACGAGVDDLAPGDRVAWLGTLGSGAYGQYSLVDARYAVKLGDTIALEVAAAVPVNYLTAQHMLVNLGGAKAGDWVLVHAAAGGVGTAILQLARRLGLRTIASVSTDKLAYAREQGATEVIDYRRESLPERVATITGSGVQLSLNPVAGASLATDLAMLAPLGQIIVFGFLGGPPDGTLATTLMPHFGKSPGLRLSDLYTYYHADPVAFGRDMAQVFSWLERGEIQPVLHEVVPLTQASRAHDALENGEVRGKLVLRHDF